MERNTGPIVVYWIFSILAFIALPFISYFTKDTGVVALLAIAACFWGIKAELLEIKDKLK